MPVFTLSVIFQLSKPFTWSSPLDPWYRGFHSQDFPLSVQS